MPAITQTLIYTLWQSIMARREIRELNGGVRFQQAMFDKPDVECVSHWKGPIFLKERWEMVYVYTHILYK